MLHNNVVITENWFPSDLAVTTRASATGVKRVIKLFVCFSPTLRYIEPKELDPMMSFAVVTIPAFAALSSVQKEIVVLTHRF